MSSPKSQSRRGDHTSPKADAQPAARAQAAADFGAVAHLLQPAAPQPAKAAQVGIQPRICVEGHDYMLVAEHYAVVNESIAAELHKTSQRDDAQDAVLDQTVKLNKAETELERVKGQLDSVRADAKNFRRLLDQEREELANVMVENVLLEEKLEAAIAKAEGRAS